MNEETILIVDDEPDILELLGFQLESAGYKTVRAPNGREALSILNDELVDVAILDVMLPGLSGIDICRKMRTMPRLKEIPVLFLTARGEESDIIDGFRSGGSDYVTKPFSSRVLLARVEALLQRVRGEKSSYTLDGLELYFERHIFKVDGVRISLTPREFGVLASLIQQRNRTISRESLLERAWGMDSTSGTRSVDIVITRIRAKLGRFENCIRTVTGYGYQWDDEEFRT
jgi:two-component system, OmpR family, alkaline phosphatase synthesis response regulator PhoP